MKEKSMAFFWIGEPSKNKWIVIAVRLARAMERRLRDLQPRKLGLNIDDQIAHYRIPVALLGSIDGVCLVGRVPFRHDENQPALCELSNIGVRPVTKTASSTVQPVDHWQFLACNDAHRKHNAVRHIAIRRRTVEDNVAHCHLRCEPWMVWRSLLALVTGRPQQDNNAA